MVYGDRLCLFCQNLLETGNFVVVRDGKWKVLPSEVLVFVLSKRVIGKKLDLFGPSASAQNGFDGLHLFHRIVDGWNDGNAYPNGDGARQKRFQIFQNLRVPNAGVSFVCFIATAFDVIKKEIGVGKNPFKICKRHVSCGVYCGVDSVFLTPFEYFSEIIYLKNTFTARKGHAAARAFVKALVLTNDLQNLVYGIFLSAYAGLLRAQHRLRVWGLALGIVTPCTTQVASLEKDRCANAGSINVRIPLDIKDDCFSFSHKNSS